MYNVIKRVEKAKGISTESKPKAPRQARNRPPEVVATAPKQVLSWDITESKSVNGKTFYVFAVICIFSRFILRLEAYPSPGAANAVDFFQKVFQQYGMKKGAPIGSIHIHSDNEPAMRAKETLALFAEYGVNLTHSRPYVSDDNPQIESLFSTCKTYYGLSSQRFFDIGKYNLFLANLANDYNHTPHGQLSNVTPEERFFGKEEQAIAKMRQADIAYYQKHPERFLRGKVAVTTTVGAQYLNPTPETRERLGMFPKVRKSKYPQDKET